ncbi:hypothetical protein [Thalassoglobus polymorphus]|uniref:Uncharacterized protein n=1 Tax=Thalassoglobus polymorphus TaxID=2527994 RepID=A0A517QQ01_9PLAN|nr:hypothetical protein [Thalassoglobus polymorphus]QDT33705.1 hypothetical protein Mal48_29590 [Thalassoglobus polymorphus]
MFTPDLVSLELRQCDDLPENTLVAPLPVIREIRCLLGNIGIQLIVGTEDAVLASKDVFDAFSAWDAMQDDIDDSQDNAHLN